MQSHAHLKLQKYLNNVSVTWSKWCLGIYTCYRYDIQVIDQASVFMDRDEVEVYKTKKKNEANNQTCWPHAWSMKDLLYGHKENFILRD